MKNKTYRLATALAVLLALCLVFVMPAAAEEGESLPAAQNGVISLTESVIVSEGTKITQDTTIKLNGHTLTLTSNSNYAISLKANLTIEGSGSVVVNGPFGICIGTSYPNVVLNIKDVTFTGDENCVYMLAGYSGSIVIDGGSFTTPYCVVNSFTSYDEKDPNANTPGATVTINGGTFIVTGTDEATSPLLYGDKTDVVVNAGTFTVTTERGLKDVLAVLSDKPTQIPIINIDAKYIDAEEGISVTKELEIRAPVKIVGVGDTKPTITCYAEKIFEVYADATFENLELVNEWYSAPYGGRCIDTRTDKITVNINNCVLTTTSVQNNQPLTIGGSDKAGLTVNLSGTTINADVAGYGVITFVPFTLNIKDNSDVAGYAALYFKSDASPSTVTVENSKLTGRNKHSGPSNNFGTVVFQSGGVTVNLNNADVVHAAATGSAHEWIFDFYGSTGNTVNINTGVTLSVTEGSSYFVRPHGDDASNTENTVSISAGVTSTVPIDSKYLADTTLVCVATADGKGYEVVEKPSENVVVPESVQGTVEETKDSNGVIIEQKVTGIDQETTDVVKETVAETDNTPKVTIKPKDDSSNTGVTFVIVGEGVDVDSNKNVTIPASATVTAEYPATDAGKPEGDTATETVKFELSVDVASISGPLPVINPEFKEEVVEDIGNKAEKVLAMLSTVGNGNTNLKGDTPITITFQVPVSLVNGLGGTDKLVVFHVKDGIAKKQTIVSIGKDGENYLVTIKGTGFSSYALAIEAQSSSPSGSATDTGSGNYQYYPRSVPTDGIVDFGTSKVVTGMELPAGSDGTVTLNIKPTFAMPENGFYAFEIDAPGYNLDAKINGGLSFQIPVADLEAAGFTANDIVLFHGTVAEDGKITWEALPTNLVKVENGIAYYKAAINGCSPFYIGFVEDGSIVNTEVVDPVTPPTETPDVPGEILPEIPGVQDDPEEPSSPAPVLGVLAALGAAVVLRRK